MTQKLVVGVLALLLSTTMVYAQKTASSKVPAEVKASFNKSHPDINKVVWELENGAYEAGFSEKGVESSEVYSKSGDLMEQK